MAQVIPIPCNKTNISPPDAPDILVFTFIYTPGTPNTPATARLDNIEDGDPSGSPKPAPPGSPGWLPLDLPLVTPLGAGLPPGLNAFQAAGIAQSITIGDFNLVLGSVSFDVDPGEPFVTAVFGNSGPGGVAVQYIGQS